MTGDSPFKKLFVDRQPVEPAKQEVSPKTVTPQAKPKKQMGRPKGKRSDPNYEQVTAYICKSTHQQVKIALLLEGQGKEFSELAEELLAEWVQSRN